MVEKIDGRTKRALDMAIARKQISRASYDAVLAGEISLRQAKELGRDRGPDTLQASSGPGSATGTPGAGSPQDGPDAPPQPVSRISKDDRSRHCIACGGLTKGGRFHPGCDAKMHRLAREYVLGERELTDEQLSYIRDETNKLQRAKARIEKEEVRRREKIAKKSERQRKKEGEAEAKKRNASE